MKQIDESIYDKWNEVKKDTSKIKRKITIKPRDIWWVKIGQNIGIEEYGKEKNFTRPVIVIRRLTTDLFIGIPTTSTIKQSNDYFHIFEYNNKTRGITKNSAMILQIRVYSIKRVLNKIGTINKKDFESIVKKAKKIITPP